MTLLNRKTRLLISSVLAWVGRLLYQCSDRSRFAVTAFVLNPKSDTVFGVDIFPLKVRGGQVLNRKLTILDRIGEKAYDLSFRVSEPVDDD